VTDGKENSSAGGPPLAIDEEPLDAALRAFGSQAASLTFTQVAAISGKSPSWWRQQARRGALKTIPFGSGQRITPAEFGRVMREGIGPLRIRTPKEGA
jgi:hypothetical protein